jgi:hypothetical protein
MSGRKVLGVVLRNIDIRPRPFVWTWGVAAIEIYGRLLGLYDYRKRRDHSVWKIAKTTKKVTLRKTA